MASKDVISSNSVTRWGEQPPPEEERLTEALLDDTAATPYPINEELNFKVALWQGDITKLQVDALINCNNEDLNERAGISGQIFVGAGPQMEEACAKLGGCPPGDAKATRGFRLPAKHVIHAVPPAWIDGGEGDAALEALYTKSLDVARRLTCATVACVPLKTKDVPREQAAHLAICAMRKRLESPEGKGIQLLVIAMRPQDVYDNMIYDNLLPLYFPRSGTEELEAARLLALHHQKNSGSAGAGAAANAPGGPTGGGAAPDFPYQPSAALAAVTQPPRANGGAGGVQGKDAAGRAVARGVVAAGGMPPSGSAYGSFLQRAGLADLSDLEALQLFYRAGVDARGRAVFLFWAGPCIACAPCVHRVCTACAPRVQCVCTTCAPRVRTTCALIHATRPSIPSHRTPSHPRPPAVAADRPRARAHAHHAHPRPVRAQRVHPRLRAHDARPGERALLRVAAQGGEIGPLPVHPPTHPPTYPPLHPSIPPTDRYLPITLPPPSAGVRPLRCAAQG